MSYYYSKSTGGFYHADIHGTNIPTDVVEISDETHQQLFNAQSQGKQITADANGSPIAVDPDSLLTPEQLAQRAKDQLIAEAQLLLSQNDYRWNNQIRWAGYDEVTKVKLTDYYNALLAVINGTQNEIPTLDL